MSILWGNNQYAVVPYKPAMNLITNGLTIGCWCYQTVQSSLQMLVSRQCSGTPNNEWWALTLQGNIPRALIGDNTSVTAVTGSTVLTLNTWYYLSMTWDGTTINLYQNNTLLNTGTRTITMAADTTEIIISANANAAGPSNITEFFLGSVEDLRIYNRALSSNEQLSIYNCKGGDIGGISSLIGKWRMNDRHAGFVVTAGDTIRDTGPYGLDGSIVGTPSYSASYLSGLKTVYQL
jgi:hypothetical protein